MWLAGGGTLRLAMKKPIVLAGLLLAPVASLHTAEPAPVDFTVKLETMM